jgi:hypothetical protein
MLTPGYPTGTLTAELDAIVRRESRLAAKADAVQEQVTEVEVVLIAASEAAGANERELSGSAADAADSLGPGRITARRDPAWSCYLASPDTRLIDAAMMTATSGNDNHACRSTVRRICPD